MIDQKELRKGNLVSLAHESNIPIVTIKTIEEDNISVSEINGHFYDYELLMPIELTPDWLERFGEKRNRPDWQYEIQVGALKWYFRWNTEWYSELGGIYLDSRFKYVHQVQNLYFSLIGQELTIKSFNQSN